MLQDESQGNGGVFAKPGLFKVKKTGTNNSIVNKWIARVGFLETYGYEG
jgi:hypothetical protein